MTIFPFTKVSFLLSIFSFVFLSAFSQEEVFNLWGKEIPGAMYSEDYKEELRLDSDGKVTGMSKVSTPTLTLFQPKEIESNGTVIVIFPGGGYSHLAIEKEGYKVARWLNELGITAFVLKYRLPSDEIMRDKSLAPLADAQQAIRYIRENAQNWNLDPEKVGVLGFSAGGHLAASLSTRFNEKVASTRNPISARPDFSILIYPVITMADSLTHEGSRKNLLGENVSSLMKMRFSTENLVNELTPPTFLIHATDDHSVPVENSLVYYAALKKSKVPVELHVYEQGGHGFGMGTKGTNQYWPESLKRWLQQRELIQLDPQDLLIGTWIIQGEPENKWVITPTEVHWVVNDKVLYRFHYSLSTDTSPSGLIHQSLDLVEIGKPNSTFHYGIDGFDSNTMTLETINPKHSYTYFYKE